MEWLAGAIVVVAFLAWDGFKRWIAFEGIQSEFDEQLDDLRAITGGLASEIAELRKELAQTQSAFAARELGAQPARRHQSILRG